MSKRGSKSDAQMRHAMRRANERYGLELNKDSYMVLCKQIQDNKGQFMGKQTNRLSVWKIEVPATSRYAPDGGTQLCNVIYDKERHRIVTFLPAGITDAKGVNLAEEGIETAA